jgi:hypothetical protein
MFERRNRFFAGRPHTAATDRLATTHPFIEKRGFYGLPLFSCRQAAAFEIRKRRIATGVLTFLGVRFGKRPLSPERRSFTDIEHLL